MEINWLKGVKPKSKARKIRSVNWRRNVEAKTA